MPPLKQLRGLAGVLAYMGVAKLVAVACAIGVCAVLASTATAAPRLVEVGTTGGSVLADGRRWAVFGTSDGMAIVDGRHRRPTVRTVRLAEPCHSQFGLPRARGAGLVAVECSFRPGQTHHRWLIYDIRARIFREPAGLHLLADGNEGQYIQGVGRRWLAYESHFHSAFVRRYQLQWHEGRRIEPTRSRRAASDLDAVRGSRPLCARVLRPAVEAWFSYRPPFAASEDPGDRRLRLRRCGRRAIALIGSDRASGPQLGDRFITWTRRARVYIRSLRSGRTRIWTMPRTSRYTAVLAYQAGRHLLVTTTTPTTPHGLLTVFRAPLY